MIRFLMGENMPIAERSQLFRREATIEIAAVGDIGVPSIGALNPKIWSWIEDHHHTLVSRNRRTMPGHLADYIADGHHALGIILTKRGYSLGVAIDDLLLI